MSSDVKATDTKPKATGATETTGAQGERTGVDTSVAIRAGHSNRSMEEDTSLQIHGILPTVLTPFDENERVDDAALRAQVQYLLDAGVHGLVLMGSLGECPYLSTDDREIIIRICVDTVGLAGRRVPIIVGVAASSTYVACEQIRQAHLLGADAVMVCLPRYFKLSLADVKRHYARLGEMDLLPILYYHFPEVTGLAFRPWEIAELLSLPNVVGIKETTFDLQSVRRHIELTRGRNCVYLAGSELIFTQFMQLGGHGVVGASSLIMPHTAAAMYQAYISGDKSKARELQSQLFETMPLLKDVRAPVHLVRTAFLLALRQGINVPLDITPMHARLKAALAGRGVPIRALTRSPLPPLSPQDEQAIRQALERVSQIEGPRGVAGRGSLGNSTPE